MAWLPLVALFAMPVPANASVVDAASKIPAANSASPRFTVELPNIVLTDVPVAWVRIKAVDATGAVDTSYNGTPSVTGIRLTVRGQSRKLPAFSRGELELRTNLHSDRTVMITDDVITVDPVAAVRTEIPVRRIWRWLALVPPMIAISLAVWSRNILVALFFGVWSGGVILAFGNVWAGLLRTLDTYLLSQLLDESQLMIVLFTLLLGAMVGVMHHGGGTEALVARMTAVAATRRHGQLLTGAMGLIIFFDDYANTMLVGTTMRPVTDRLRISREKLAFLVDSTAAPIAGLAIISTWVGVEIGYIQTTYEQLGLETEAYATFLATIPYRFYAWLLLAFVLLVATVGRDFGPMLRAERRTYGDDGVPSDAASSNTVATATAANAGTRPATGQGSGSIAPHRQLLRAALIPLATLLLLILAGLWWTGREGLLQTNSQRMAEGLPPLPGSLWSLLEHAESNRVLFVASFLASAAAVMAVTVSGALPLNMAMDAWLDGAKSMFVAVVILVLAWGIAAVCDSERLNTAGFLVQLTRGLLPVEWMPTLAFLIAGVIAFATGSSWSTMGLLMPLFIAMTYYLLADRGIAAPQHPLLLAVIGGVLAGAIFGDHCSPISDTTVLSSAAAGCDHLDHVTTQLPYAMTVGVAAVLLGYLPAGFGWSPYVLLPAGVFALYLVVRYCGRRVEDEAT